MWVHQSLQAASLQVQHCGGQTGLLKCIRYPLRDGQSCLNGVNLCLGWLPVLESQGCQYCPLGGIFFIYISYSDGDLYSW